jgi:flagellar hook-associated protein 3 FlgL
MSTRIATSQIFDGSNQHISNARAKEVASAEKAATQKAINRPSDDPRGWVLINRLKDEQSINDTVAKNGELASNILSATETIVAQLQDNCIRAHELAVSTAGSVTSAQKRQLIKAEVEKLYQVTIQTMNTRFGNRTLLAGFKTEGLAYDQEGHFIGDEGKIEIDIDRGVRATLNLDTKLAVEGKGLQKGMNIPQAFKTFIEGLDTNNDKLINDALGEFYKSVDQLSIARVEIGAQQGNIHRALESLGNVKLGNADAISKVEDVDATKAFSDLAKDQTILNAALNTTHKILTQTPPDVLFR